MKIDILRERRAFECRNGKNAIMRNMQEEKEMEKNGRSVCQDKLDW